MAIVCCNYEISKSLLTSCSVLTLGDDRKCCKHNRMLVIPINCRFIHFNKFKIQTKKNNKNRNFSLRNILKNIAKYSAFFGREVLYFATIPKDRGVCREDDLLVRSPWFDTLSTLHMQPYIGLLQSG